MILSREVAKYFSNKLYQVQVCTYIAVQTENEQFPGYEKIEVLVIIPTSSGKTDLRPILPVADCEGKVLIITSGKFGSLEEWYKARNLMCKFPVKNFIQNSEKALEQDS